MRGLFVLFFLIPCLSIAQDVGIHFEKNLSWQQIQAKANAENKLIFMDCNASWCVPCKHMAADVFTLPQVGKLVNDNFIAVSVQMDRTGTDDQQTKEWYKDADQITRAYQISSYPTYLFFTADGRIVHRGGGSMAPEAFMKVINDARDPNKQYYTLLEKYKHGDRDSTMLSQLVLSSASLDDPELTSRYLNEYISNVTNLYTSFNLDFFSHFTKTSKDEGFKIWFRNSSKIDAIMGKDYAERRVSNIIMKEDANVIAANAKAEEGLKLLGNSGGQAIYSGIDSTKQQPIPPDWSQMYNGISTKYGPYYADRITKWTKINYYQTRKDWPGYDKALVEYLDSYKGTISKPMQLNGFAWDIFTHSQNKLELEAAISWSKTAITEGENDPYFDNYLDTYANLLYKTGRKEEAITWEKKALRASSEKDKEQVEQTLAKMQSGVKTW